jgi:formylglycine-generating enzyme
MMNLSLLMRRRGITGPVVNIKTAKGQDSFFYKLPKFTLESLGAGFGTGTHPAFIVGGVEKPFIYVGVHQAVEIDGEMVSQPGFNPRVSINHDQAVTLAKATGPGFCVCTNAMYAALALQCRAAGVFPRGNNEHGRAYNATDEFGLNALGEPTSGGVPGVHTVIVSGSSPLAWRHPPTEQGIENLNGNVWEWSPGNRVVDGEIQIIADNDAVLHATDLSASGPWQAIDKDSGALVAPGSAGTVKYATSGTADGTLVRSSGGPFSGMVAHGVSVAALDRLRALSLMQPGAPIESDGFFVDLSGERLPGRGGGWASGSTAGVFAFGSTVGRTTANSITGFRPAFVI